MKIVSDENYINRILLLDQVEALLDEVIEEWGYQEMADGIAKVMDIIKSMPNLKMDRIDASLVARHRCFEYKKENLEIDSEFLKEK